MKVIIFMRWNPGAAENGAEDEHVKDAAQGVVEGVAEGVAEGMP